MEASLDTQAKQQPADSKYRPPLPMVHSALDEYGLDPYEFRIYAHIVRRTGGKLDGECFAKLEEIAKTCQMSVRKAQYSLAVLVDAGFITKESRRGRTDTYKLLPRSNWVDEFHLPIIREKVRYGI